MATHGVKYTQLSDANGMDRMIEDSATEDIYPGIFVMRPKWSGRNQAEALLTTLFDVTFFVFCAADSIERENQDAAYDRAEEIASSVITKLQADRREYRNYLDFDSIRSEPVLYHSGLDSAMAYEVKFKMALAAGEIFG